MSFYDRQMIKQYYQYYRYYDKLTNQTNISSYRFFYSKYFFLPQYPRLRYYTHGGKFRKLITENMKLRLPMADINCYIWIYIHYYKLQLKCYICFCLLILLILLFVVVDFVYSLFNSFYCSAGFSVCFTFLPHIITLLFVLSLCIRTL